jgi:hypothetical protein
MEASSPAGAVARVASNGCPGGVEALVVNERTSNAQHQKQVFHSWHLNKKRP